MSKDIFYEEDDNSVVSEKENSQNKTKSSSNQKKEASEKEVNESNNQKEIEREKESEKVSSDDGFSSDKYYYVELPSNGLLDYSRTVEHRDVLWKDQKALSSTNQQTFTRTLNRVIKSILKEPEWYEEMTIIDRDYLLVWVFVNNFSTKKTIEFNCPDCGNIDKEEWDIRSLDVEELSEDYVEPFKLPLQKGGNVWLRLSRVKDELKAEEFLRKNDKVEDTLETLIMYQTIDTGMELPLKGQIKWIENNLTAKDMAMIREFHNHFNYGINDLIEHECTECGASVYGRFPFRLEEIFAPSVSEDFENILQANKGT